MKNITKEIRPYGKHIKSIYAYNAPKNHPESYVKVGSTTGDPFDRIKSQTGTAGITANKLAYSGL